MENPSRVVLDAARRTLARQSFCTLATASRANRPHVVGVGYAAVAGRLYVHTIDGSRKVKNIRANPHVAVCVPVRKLPVAPPFCVQFQGVAEILSPSEPELAQLLESGRLKKITAHGALDVPGTCFIRITPGRTLSTYGVGVPFLTLLRDPFHANRTVAAVG
jgi:nitroimidazol reductase NimA-like FMN-containing flavoprotein (pyridoxamine 5'-phosphate oxidase superfamily)